MWVVRYIAPNDLRHRTLKATTKTAGVQQFASCRAAQRAPKVGKNQLRDSHTRGLARTVELPPAHHLRCEKHALSTAFRAIVLREERAPMATAQKSQENRFLAFANLFKGYMGVMPIITAALAPLLTAMNVLPTYASQRKPLATVAGVLGFLLVAWLFYVRRTIALGSIKRRIRVFFNLCPIVLILGAIICYVAYSNTLDTSVKEAAQPPVTRSQALGEWSKEHDVPNSVQLQLLYLGMFLFCEASFVMMALREYANDVRGISEYEWMFGAQDGSPVTAPAPPSGAVLPVVSEMQPVEKV
jgi:hypothetical protein